MFIMLVRNNFKDYFVKKNQIKTNIANEINENEDGVELDNFKLYIRGATLTLFYILMSPVIGSLISIVLAFILPLLSLLSFIIVLILRFAIRMKRKPKDKLDNIELSDGEKEFLGNIKRNIYGDEE